MCESQACEIAQIMGLETKKKSTSNSSSSSSGSSR